MRVYRAVWFAALVLIAPSAAPNETGYVVLQSGEVDGGTPVHDRGLFGQGQIVAVMDTGLDWDSCYFAEANGGMPAVNLTILDRHVDTSRRKVVAYDFLYSCIDWPGASGCEMPESPAAWDNQGHGTHAAAGVAADKGTPLFHDFGDGIAAGARLVVQDGGYIGGDDCTSRPGFGCPLRDLTPVLQQAWDQGARVHVNSWGDRQGVPADQPPPTGNYTAAAAQIDAFVVANPEMLVVFNAGNAGLRGAGSVSSPGVAKNAIQVGGAEGAGSGLFVVDYSGTGPTQDGRIKPDFVGPVNITGADTDGDPSSGNCDVSTQGGTSFSSPPVAGAAALVRQYYLEGWYPTGTPRIEDRLTPVAALVRATMMASTIHVPRWSSSAGVVSIDSLPSYEQGFGFPVLDNALYFAGDRRKLFAVQHDADDALREGETAKFSLAVSAAQPLRVALAWIDPPGDPDTASGAQLVNDLDLVVTAPHGQVMLGNEALHPGTADRVNNAEMVDVASPGEGVWVIEVAGRRVASAQGFALVVTGELSAPPPTRRHPVRR